MTSGGKVLFIDDEPEVRASGAQTLELSGFEVTALASAEEAVEHLGEDWPGVVVSDVRMPRMDGMALLKRVRAMDAELPVVLVTGHGDISMALQAIRDGAYDFLEKPAPPEYLIDVVARALDKRRLVLENRALRRELNVLVETDGCIIGRTPVMVHLRDTIANLADAGVDVLVVGETGTGKELAARCLHDFGARREGRFVAVNCGALPETIIESELFGHEAGAFTGADRKRIGKIEYAHRGTLFLDEIDCMPVHLQVKLLRVLQERTVERLGGNETVPVDIRVVAAVKIDLKKACERGEFREDLYYRLNVVNLSLPPLRDRVDDIPLLFRHFVIAACSRYQRPIPPLEPAQAARLTAHDWPGNVRELKNAAERFVLGIAGDGPHLAGMAADPPEPAALPDQVDRIEKQLIIQALERCGGRINDTAAALGIPRKALYLRMRKFGLQRDDFRRNPDVDDMTHGG